MKQNVADYGCFLQAAPSPVDFSALCLRCVCQKAHKEKEAEASSFISQQRVLGSTSHQTFSDVL